jgi:hypothetical protein
MNPIKSKLKEVNLQKLIVNDHINVLFIELCLNTEMISQMRVPSKLK